jgi:ubiquinone/menaquinone biosynthesis C-methylase UbiE
MTNQPQGPARGAARHDEGDAWQEQDFVDKWVTRDGDRQDKRVPMIQDFLMLAPFEDGAAISVLDVGAGYGLVSSEVLKRYDKAEMTLQDISEPMFGYARKKLADHESQLSFVLSDFSDADWSEALGGPFDLVVSAYAVHNLYDDGKISSVYADVYRLLKPGGAFLNLDYAPQAGGNEAHIKWLRDAGFDRVECTQATDRISKLAAYRSAS